jgi:hypothetical protein
MQRMNKRNKIRFINVHTFAQSLFQYDLYAKRVLSLAGATIGVIYADSLGIHVIGSGLFCARSLIKKYAVK